MSTLEKAIFTILGIYILAAGTVAVLDFTHILPLSTILHFGAKQEQTTVNPVPTTQQAHEFSLTQLTPVPSGDAFKQLVQVSGSPNATITIFGHVDEIDQSNGKTYLSITKDDGTTVKQLAPLIDGAGINIYTIQDGKKIQKQGTSSDIKKGDYVMVTYNVNPQTGTTVITGVNLNR